MTPITLYLVATRDRLRVLKPDWDGVLHPTFEAAKRELDVCNDFDGEPMKDGLGVLLRCEVVDCSDAAMMDAIHAENERVNDTAGGAS